MKRRVKRMAPDADRCRTGLERMAQLRRFYANHRMSDAAYVTKRFKERKGKTKRMFPTPVRTWRQERAAEFMAAWSRG